MDGPIQPGQAAEFSKTITEADIVLFSGISGDHNPLHVDSEAAGRSRFGERIAHGMLTASLLCRVLGMQLPGPGTIHLEQSLRFVGPVRIGDTVTARVEVMEHQANNRALLRTTCRTQRGDLVVDGEAVVLLPAGRSKDESAG
jgi:3-hydroxybutyryl-CoA dehydratase